MLQTQANPRPRRKPSTSCADSKLRRNPFGRYRWVEAKTVRAPEVKDEVLGKLLAAWRRFSYDGFPESTYRTVLKLIEGINYSPEDITNFSIVMAAFEEEKDFPRKAGGFLSALVNTSRDNDHLIITQHLHHRPLDWLCYRNTKNVRIQGDVGYGFGEDMTSGVVSITGNAPIFPSPCDGPKGGEIHIEGDVSNFQPTKGAKLYHQGKLITGEKPGEN